MGSSTSLSANFEANCVGDFVDFPAHCFSRKRQLRAVFLRPDIQHSGHMTFVESTFAAVF